VKAEDSSWRGWRTRSFFGGAESFTSFGVKLADEASCSASYQFPCGDVLASTSVDVDTQRSVLFYVSGSMRRMRAKGFMATEVLDILNWCATAMSSIERCKIPRSRSGTTLR